MVRHTSEFEPGDWSDPRSRAGVSDEVPRWFVVLGAVAGVAIVAVLLRYAVDLLGLVSIIVLVGFSIRTITDWLTDTESVSGWSLIAVLAGAIGTAATGLWLFGSVGSDRVQRVEQRLPPGVARSIEWAESRGWGGRVLLPDMRPARTRTGAATAAGTLSPPSPSPRVRRSEGSTASGTRPAPPDNPAERAPTTQGNAGSPPESSGADGEQYATATRLTASPSRSVVGRSVRLTAAVVSHTGAPLPEGTVIFRRGNVIVGSARLRPAGSSAVAELTALDLPVGTHELVAEYVGGGSFTMSRSSVVQQIVARD